MTTKLHYLNERPTLSLPTWEAKFSSSAENDFCKHRYSKTPNLFNELLVYSLKKWLKSWTIEVQEKI